MARSLSIVVASLFAFAFACGEGDSPIVTTTGVTTNVTTLTPEGSSTSSTTAGASSTSGDSAGGSTTTTSSTSTSSTGSTTDSFDSTTTGDSSTGPASSGTTAVDPIQECLDNVDPGDECTACMCVNCLELWEACEATVNPYLEDFGCMAIQLCAQKEGCYGIHCLYDCMSTISFSGGQGSDSFKMWLKLSNCLQPPCQIMCPWG